MLGRRNFEPRDLRPSQCSRLRRGYLGLLVWRERFGLFEILRAPRRQQTAFQRLLLVFYPELQRDELLQLSL